MTELASQQRKIIHCDCDCFYAAVEMRDDPSLATLPIAVGGSAERRGVVATCNYAAREFGVHSAMAMIRAQRICPSLVVVPPDFNKYRAVAAQIRDIFGDFTELVEPLSLDEAFLDVSNSELHQGSATRMAEAIRARIKAEVGITISAGVAPSKFLAKIASDWRKPDGLFVIRPEQVDDFVQVLPVGKLFGVGKVTEKKLHGLNVLTCGDLRGLSLMKLTEHFGVLGQRLFELSRGIDQRPVRTDRRRKSLSVETTFVDDLPNVQACLTHLPSLFGELQERYEKVDSTYRVSRHYLKMRFSDFTSTTIERELPDGITLKGYQNLCEQAWQRGEQGVRLLGIGLRFVDLAALDESHQMAFAFDPE
ncbi:MAG: DNA polymerase IV [Gammaproteobacteria bacterium]|nr:DNA polymerase IV [Gammaproteobacteria bacterium]MBQ0840664.1 DNA polymerase IV [Gammaproteobacteria bacterium]